MYKFAVIEYGVVQNVIIAESAEIAEAVTGKTCVEPLDAGIGWVYNAETGEFTAPSSLEIVDESVPTEPEPETPLAE